MAHFAKIENGFVTGVYVVANRDIQDDDGNESEAIGVEFCRRVIGPGEYVQASYSASFRGKYAGVGDRWDPDLDAFIAPE